MAYLVSIASRAERDLADLYAALSCYNGLKEAILSLEERPNLCPITPERRQFRHLLYGRKPHVYRVIFRVLEGRKQVHVLHIRHGARPSLEAPGG